jgi:glycosyltransferase involved in cell wall biosynthesis
MTDSASLLPDRRAKSPPPGHRVAPPRVSVVLPTHNRPAWLSEALTSVLAGDFDDLEVIVSNNGNREDTRRIQAAMPDARVRWIEQDPALGRGENFLAALALARGKYVAPLHDDDRWSPRFLSTLVPPLERHAEAVLAFSDHYVVDDRGAVDPVETEANTERWGRSKLAEGLHRPFFGAVARQSLAITACVFRRDALPLEQFPPDVGAFDDIWMFYLLAKTGGAAYFSAERLLYYRAHAAQWSSAAKLSAHLAAIRGRRRMLRDPCLRPHQAVVAKRLARDHVLVGGELLRQGERREARSNLVAAIRLDPTLKALGGWAASWIVSSKLLARL